MVCFCLHLPNARGFNTCWRLECDWQGVLATFPVIVAKFLKKLKEEKVYWGSRFHGMVPWGGKPWQPELEAAVHNVFTDRKGGQCMLFSLHPFHLVWQLECVFLHLLSYLQNPSKASWALSPWQFWIPSSWHKSVAYSKVLVSFSFNSNMLSHWLCLLSLYSSIAQFCSAIDESNLFINQW